MDKQKLFFGAVLTGIIIFVVLFLSLSSTSVPESIVLNEDFVFSEAEFDFGIVKQSGGLVSHDYTFIYNGTEDLTITAVPTSCGCTSAEVNVSTLSSGDRGIVTVTFDPNLHAEPEGRFYKTITLLTDPVLEISPELKIWVEMDLDLGPEFYKEAIHEGEELFEAENSVSEKDYQTISALTLKEAMKDKHFFLIDVHTPEQSHIEGTDAVIPFDEIADKVSLLPADKNGRIVLYCRSGSMSQQAAQTLVDLGYTNVVHLEGGINAYQGE